MVQTDLWRKENQRSLPIWLPLFAAALLIARIVSWHFQPAAVPTDLMVWVPASEARLRASTSRKLILYDFSAEWCGPCHMLDEVVFDDPDLARKIKNRFVTVKVMDRVREDGANPAEVEALQRKYGVRAFPTIIIADASGALHQKVEGFIGKRNFEQMIDGVR